MTPVGVISFKSGDETNPHFSTHTLAVFVILTGMELLGICQSFVYGLENTADSKSCTNEAFAGVDQPWASRHGRDIKPSEHPENTYNGGRGPANTNQAVRWRWTKKDGGQRYPTSTVRRNSDKSKDNRMYLLVNEEQSVSCCGYVIGWEFQASRRAQIRPITFQLWRPLRNNTQRSYQLIGQHLFWYMRDSNRLKTSKVDEEDHVLVHPGDLIGWHTPLGDVIDYKPTSSLDAPVYVITNSTGSSFIGQTLYVNERQVKQGRIYGIKALLQSATRPTFADLPRRVTFKCPVDEGHHVADIRAISDTGQGRMTYNIKGYSPWFRIHHKTGKVSTKRAVHGNFTTQIAIQVTSTCEQTAVSALTLECIHLSEEEMANKKRGKTQAPHISERPSFDVRSAHHVTFRESLTSEVELYNVSKNATIDDIICSISSSDPPISHDVLYASGNLLLLTSNGNVTHNATPEIYIRFKCIQSDGSIREGGVVVHVIRDLEPVFINIPARVSVSAKQRRVGDEIYHVIASDRDSASLTFDSKNCSCPFAVTSDGRVVVTENLRKATQFTFHLDLFVTDGYRTVGPAVLTINMKELNRPPEFISLPQKVIVRENSQGLVVTIMSHDPDDDDDVTLHWAWQHVEAATYFSLDESAHQVFVRPGVTIDYEHLKQDLNVTSFPLLLTLDDGALTSPTQRILISVTDENEAPTFSAKTLSITCKEGEAGKSVSTLDLRDICADPDRDQLSFSIIVNTSAKEGVPSKQSSQIETPLRSSQSSPFRIDSRSGWLFLSCDVDVTREEAERRHTLLIGAIDPGGLSAHLTVLISLTFVNTAPQLIGLPARASVLENQSPSDVIFKAVSLDRDGDSITFRHQVNNSLSAGWIQADSESGAVRLTNRRPALAQDTTVNVTIIFTAFDGYSVSEPGVFTLTVVGVNDPPQFAAKQYLFSISETQVGLPLSFDPNFVLDPDPEDLLTFTLSGEAIAGHSSDVMVNSTTGALRIRSDYDIDAVGMPSGVTLQLVVTDILGLKDTAQIRIRIADVNDNSPEVENDGTTLYMDIDVKPGSGIGQVLARDRDSGENGEISFHVVGSTLNDTASYFSVDSEGWITTATRFYPCKDSSISLYLAVADRGWPSKITMATFNIVLMNRTDNDTMLSSLASQESSSSSRSEHAQNSGALILIGLVSGCAAAIFILSYQLWRARRALRSLQFQRPPTTHQDYRFSWFPAQLTEEETEPNDNPCTTSAFSGTTNSVINQNFRYYEGGMPEESSYHRCQYQDHRSDQRAVRLRDGDWSEVSLSSSGENSQACDKTGNKQTSGDLEGQDAQEFVVERGSFTRRGDSRVDLHRRRHCQEEVGGANEDKHINTCNRWLAGEKSAISLQSIEEPEKQGMDQEKIHVHNKLLPIAPDTENLPSVRTELLTPLESTKTVQEYEQIDSDVLKVTQHGFERVLEEDSDDDKCGNVRFEAKSTKHFENGRPTSTTIIPLNKPSQYRQHHAHHNKGKPENNSEKLKNNQPCSMSMSYSLSQKVGLRILQKCPVQVSDDAASYPSKVYDIHTDQWKNSRGFSRQARPQDVGLSSKHHTMSQPVFHKQLASPFGSDSDTCKSSVVESETLLSKTEFMQHGSIDIHAAVKMGETAESVGQGGMKNSSVGFSSAYSTEEGITEF